MAGGYPHGVTLTVIRTTPGGTDPYGDPLPGTQTRTKVPGCVVYPRYGESEPTQRGREGVIVGLTALLPADAPSLTYADQVEYGGALYEVEGEPFTYRSPLTGWVPGTQVALRRAVG